MPPPPTAAARRPATAAPPAEEYQLPVVAGPGDGRRRCSAGWRLGSRWSWQPRWCRGDGTAEGLVKLGALLRAAALLAMLLRHVALAGDQLTGRGLSGRGLSAGQLRAGPHGAGQLSDGQLLGACAFAVVFAWLLAWPYLLPWYDGLGWALLVLLPASRLDWLLLARTAGLAIGYLPARGQVTVPAGLTWLESVVRTAVTPAVLLAVIVATFAWFWPWHRARAVTP